MDIVIIANAWSAAAKNPTGKHQIALCLASKGHRVLWIEGAGMRRPRAASTSDRGRILTKIRSAACGIRRVHPGIWHIAPLIVPVPGSAWIRRLNAAIYALAGILCAKWLGFRKPVLINFLPVVPLTQHLWPWKTVYFCVDRWDQFDIYDGSLMRRVDAECCTQADWVLTTSQDLQSRCAPRNPRTYHIGHGVDWRHFNKAANPESLFARPTDLPAGPIIGFFGLLSEWVDQALIVRLAQALQGTDAKECRASVVLIGNADTAIDSLEAQPGIHLLGPKPFADLPRYAAFFDVAIIPFIVNALTIAVNPIKLREMLAAGCPVVATALPEVEQIASCNPFVDTAGSAETFITKVCERLSKGLTAATRQQISDSVRNETWDAKVDQILDIIT